MSNNSFNNTHGGEASDWDLFRLSKSREIADICANTLRSYHAKGLPFYRKGRAVFVSRRELEFFIRNSASNSN